jgi:hypothetical protein
MQANEPAPVSIPFEHNDSIPSPDRDTPWGRQRPCSPRSAPPESITVEGDSKVKITKIRTLTVAAPPHRNWVFVKLETDQPGLYGWGEGTLEWKTRGVVGTVEDFVPIVLGQDPRDVTRVVELLQRTSFWPLGVIGLSALSAIEQADRPRPWCGSR